LDWVFYLVIGDSMPDLDIEILVSYSIGSFAIGYGLGLLFVHLKKLFDAIL